MQLYHAKRPLMCQIDRQHFSIDFHSIGMQQWPPIYVFSAHNYRFLSLFLPKYSHMDQLVQFQQHSRVETQLIIVPNNVKNKGLIEFIVYLGEEVLGLETLA